MKVQTGKDFGERECPSCACNVPANSNRCPICSYEFPALPRRKGLALAAGLLMLFILLWVLFV